MPFYTASEWQSHFCSNLKLILVNHFTILELSKYKIQPSFVTMKTIQNIDLDNKIRLEINLERE